jgi:uncharacterized protein
MSGRPVIDSLEFAREGRHIAGEVAVVNLGRLHDQLAETAGTLQYDLAGGIDPRGRPQLRLAVRGSLQLRCQRCLGALAEPLDVASDLLLGDEEQAAADAEEGEPDWIVASRTLDVWSLVEDEVLLALPLAPRHDEGVCETSVAGARQEKTSPFAALASLRRPRN